MSFTHSPDFSDVLTETLGYLNRNELIKINPTNRLFHRRISTYFSTYPLLMLDRLNVEVNEDCTYQIFYTKSWARNDKRPFLTTLVPQYLRFKSSYISIKSIMQQLPDFHPIKHIWTDLNLVISFDKCLSRQFLDQFLTSVANQPIYLKALTLRSMSLSPKMPVICLDPLTLGCEKLKLDFVLWEPSNILEYLHSGCSLKQGRRLEITQRNVSQEQLDELVGGIENRFITATYACPFKLVLHIHINPVMTSNYRYGQKNSTTMEYLEVAPVTGLTFTIVRANIV